MINTPAGERFSLLGWLKQSHLGRLVLSSTGGGANLECERHHSPQGASIVPYCPGVRVRLYLSGLPVPKHFLSCQRRSWGFNLGSSMVTVGCSSWMFNGIWVFTVIDHVANRVWVFTVMVCVFDGSHLQQEEHPGSLADSSVCKLPDIIESGCFILGLVSPLTWSDGEVLQVCGCFSHGQPVLVRLNSSGCFQPRRVPVGFSKRKNSPGLWCLQPRSTGVVFCWMSAVLGLIKGRGGRKVNSTSATSISPTGLVLVRWVVCQHYLWKRRN